MATKHFLIIVTAMLMLPQLARAEICTVDDGFWLQPRSGLTVLNNAAIKPCVSALLADNQSKLFINYNDTDESSISATELRQWLIALALPAARIILKKQAASTNTISLETQHD